MHLLWQLEYYTVTENIIFESSYESISFTVASLHKGNLPVIRLYINIQAISTFQQI